MRINIDVIPHSEQRYETVGDWWVGEDGEVQIRASEMSEEAYSALVIIHELNEVLIEAVRRTGGLRVPQSLVNETDAWDKAYEAARTEENEVGEPGADPRCPAYRGHMAASAIEHVVAMILGINYNDYADEIAKL